MLSQLGVFVIGVDVQCVRLSYVEVSMSRGKICRVFKLNVYEVLVRVEDEERAELMV